LVSSADGTSVSWYKRDPQLAKDIMRRSIAIHARLAKEWPRLAEEYRAALPDLVSSKTWHGTFEASKDKD
jgi:galactofuranosylgalactofuranosylrhamnosyl-N-acetylglucosaminyl-diphospho-decaprenol beta-1,5/1,6-galactofuranosyltransferase